MVDSRAIALSRTADGHRMNKLEAEWDHWLGLGHAFWRDDEAVHVDQLIVKTQIFEPVKLRLGHNLSYTPDFMVVLGDGTIEFHETKGFWRDDARVKIKAAAHQYPMFRFLAIQKRTKKRGGGWDIEEIKP